MARRIQYERRHGRYRVYDDTITTWKVVDTVTGTIVEAGLPHYEAYLRANKLNAEGIDEDADQEQ